MKTPPEIYVCSSAMLPGGPTQCAGIVWQFEPDDTLTLKEFWEIIAIFPAHFHTVELLRQGFGFRTQEDSDAFRDMLEDRLARFFKVFAGLLMEPMYR